MKLELKAFGEKNTGKTYILERVQELLERYGFKTHYHPDKEHEMVFERQDHFHRFIQDDTEYISINKNTSSSEQIKEKLIEQTIKSQTWYRDFIIEYYRFWDDIVTVGMLKTIRRILQEMLEEIELKLEESEKPQYLLSKTQLGEK